MKLCYLTELVEPCGARPRKCLFIYLRAAARAQNPLSRQPTLPVPDSNPPAVLTSEQRQHRLAREIVRKRGRAGGQATVEAPG
jgi:hypothetical protein